MRVGTKKAAHLCPCADPSTCMMLPDSATPFSADNTAKDAWAQAAATLGATADARKET